MNFDIITYAICLAPTIILMILFIMINVPYYKIIHGAKTNRFLARTIFLNIIAILIGWFPVVLYWPDFSVRYLLSASCVFGAIACVGSRFIYTEIIPKQLSQELVRLIQDKVRKEQDK